MPQFYAADDLFVITTFMTVVKNIQLFAADPNVTANFQRGCSQVRDVSLNTSCFPDEAGLTEAALRKRLRTADIVVTSEVGVAPEVVEAVVNAALDLRKPVLLVDDGPRRPFSERFLPAESPGEPALIHRSASFQQLADAIRQLKG